MVNSFKLISYDPHPPQTLLQQCWYKIDVYINLYSSGKLLTLGWETNHIVVIAGGWKFRDFPAGPTRWWGTTLRRQCLGMVNSFKLISYDPHPPQTLLQQCWYKIDVFINMYSSGKLSTLGWETCGGRSYEINLKELIIPKHYLLSVVPHHLVGPPGKSRNFQHTSNIR